MFWGDKLRLNTFPNRPPYLHSGICLSTALYSKAATARRTAACETGLRRRVTEDQGSIAGCSKRIGQPLRTHETYYGPGDWDLGPANIPLAIQVDLRLGAAARGRPGHIGRRPAAAGGRITVRGLLTVSWVGPVSPRNRGRIRFVRGSLLNAYWQHRGSRPGGVGPGAGW